MIIHKLIAHHLQSRDDAGFYTMQAMDALAWMERNGVTFGPAVKALDLGCGHGIFGAEMMKRGCDVLFADYDNYLDPAIPTERFRKFDIDREDAAMLGQFDLVICSNVYEHLSKPDKFINSARDFLKPGGTLFLSWTNWLSPWGGHEFSPLHYFGPRLGPRIYDKIKGPGRKHTPYENLFPTYIGETMRKIRAQPDLRIRKVSPRYYPEFGFITSLPIVREFLTWNCAMLIERKR